MKLDYLFRINLMGVVAEVLSEYKPVEMSARIEGSIRVHLVNIINRTAQHMANDKGFFYHFEHKNSQYYDKPHTPMSPEQYKVAVESVLVRLANKMIGEVPQDKQVNALQQFIDFVSGISAGAFYKGHHNPEPMRAAQKDVDPAGFVAGLALREQVSGNAQSNNLDRVDYFPTAKEQLTTPGSTMVEFCVALRDELLVLENAKMLRSNGTSLWVEDTLAERGVMIPNAWEHMRARLADWITTSVQNFVREENMFPKGTNIAPLERAVSKVIDHFAQNILGLNQTEPVDGEEARAKTRKLETLKVAVHRGLSLDCVRDENAQLRGQDQDRRFADTSMVKLLPPHSGLVVYEHEFLSSPQGESALLLTGAIRAMLRPKDKSNAYSLTLFMSKIRSLAPMGNATEQFIQDMNTTLCDAIAEILVQDNEARLVATIGARLNDAGLDGQALSKKIIEFQKAKDDALASQQAGLEDARSVIADAEVDLSAEGKEVPEASGTIVTEQTAAEKKIEQLLADLTPDEIEVLKVTLLETA